MPLRAAAAAAMLLFDAALQRRHAMLPPRC